MATHTGRPGPYRDYPILPGLHGLSNVPTSVKHDPLDLKPTPCYAHFKRNCKEAACQKATSKWTVEYQPKKYPEWNIPRNPRHPKPEQNAPLKQDPEDRALCILPDIDEWEMEFLPVDELNTAQDRRSKEMIREQIMWRRVLKGDGWDFVGGAHGQWAVEIKDETGTESEKGLVVEESSVDEEFDLVVLPKVRQGGS
jgi:hypothetical protein